MILKLSHIISTITFLNIAIIQLSAFPIKLLTARVPLPKCFYYISYMCDPSWTTHMKLELMVYQSPRLQALLLTLSHFYVTILGNQSITRLTTLIYCHIVLKNVVAWLVFPNMLDMIWPSGYLLMIIQISYFVLTSALLGNQWNPIFALNLFVGSHIPFSNSFHTEIRKLCHVLKNLQERTIRIKNWPWVKTYQRKKLLKKLGILMHPKCLSWIHLVLLVAHILCHPKNMAKNSRSVLLKWLMNMIVLSQ